MVIETKNVIDSFECDWLIELSDNMLSNNKLSDNNLTSELVDNRSFFKPMTIEEILISIIIGGKIYFTCFEMLVSICKWVLVLKVCWAKGLES